MVGHVTLSYGQTGLPRPRLPKRLPTDKLTTVAARGSSDVHFRVLASPSFGGTTIVAVPTREVDQTLHRLLLVEALVIGGVLLTLAALAFFVVRLGLRPLERMGRPPARSPPATCRAGSAPPRSAPRSGASAWR